MRFVEPKVYMIGETKLDLGQTRLMLRALGGRTALEWMSRTSPNSRSEGEMLTEIAGRICYKSFGVGLNPNVKKIRTSSKEYIQNTLSKGDGSIFEHASCTFAFIDVSRVFTHELVRHRVGVAISQESLRYVRPTDLALWIPPELAERKMKFKAIVERMEEDYKSLENDYDWDSMNFDEKKRVTSALRRIAPDGMATSIIWTANHRTIRHVITMRTAESAEVEIRYIFDKVARVMKRKFPLIYGDFQHTKLPDGTWSWRPKFVKA